MHKYPAKFIPQLPRWALAYDPETPTDVVLDPFCGSGTTLVEAGLIGSESIGVDISPLACLITEAKCSDLTGSAGDVDSLTKKIVEDASKKFQIYKRNLAANVGSACLGMHYTWSNWFEAERLSKLLALRDSIKKNCRSRAFQIFSLAVLSSITKSCSSLNEDQIKVRLDREKVPTDPFTSFAKILPVTAQNQLALSGRYVAAGAKHTVLAGSAAELKLRANSVHRIITSPPYINAVDYTMAHKYNLFVLGMLLPEMFKDHCREYIGVTERAVRAVDLKSPPKSGVPTADGVIQALLHQGTPTSRNRAFVVAQYFSEMRKSFSEGYRVLRPGGLYFLVIGETNRICGLTVQTASILEDAANSVGFETETSFYHVLANRSSMRLNRSDTGGTIGREQIYVFRKS